MLEPRGRGSHWTSSNPGLTLSSVPERARGTRSRNQDDVLFPRPPGIEMKTWAQLRLSPLRLWLLVHRTQILKTFCPEGTNMGP